MRKVVGFIVAVIILMITSIVYQFSKILIKDSDFALNMYEQYDRVGVFIVSFIGVLPLVIGIYLVRISWKAITSKKTENIKSTQNDNDTSLSKAVYNHSKDIASEVKPKINEYKENHKSTKNVNISLDEINNSEQRIHIDNFDDNYFTNLKKDNPIALNEDELYEKVMIEIEEDKKVKSTWAKALAQGDGDKDKAESLYIKERVKKLKEENKINKVEKKQHVIENNISSKENEWSDTSIKNNEFKYCSDCGESNNKNNEFCWKCKSKLYKVQALRYE